MNKKRVTIKDVAKKAGVSTTIVSYVLNKTKGRSVKEETKKRIFDAVRELRYIPNIQATSMRLGFSKLICLISFWHTSSSVFFKTLEGIQQSAMEQGYSLIFCNLYKHDNPNIYIDLIKHHMVDGLILLAPTEGYTRFIKENHIQAIKTLNLPTILINCDNTSPFDNISFNFYETTKQCLSYLIKKDYKHIVYVKPSLYEQNHAHSILREKGYTENYQGEKLCITVNELEKLHRYKNNRIALLCNKAHYGLRAINELEKLSITNVSIICASDEDYLNIIKPSITSCEIPYYEIGYESFNQLYAKIRGKDFLKNNIPLPRIIERKSTT